MPVEITGNDLLRLLDEKVADTAWLQSLNKVFSFEQEVETLEAQLVSID